MKILLAGCFGNLGKEILRELTLSGHKVVGINRSIKDTVKNKNVIIKQFDITNSEKLNGICSGIDCVISTVGLTAASKVTKSGKTANIKFGRWTLSNDMTAEMKYGISSFKDYVNSIY